MMLSRNSDRRRATPKAGALARVTTAIRALPFVGALLVGIAVPRALFAQSNGLRVAVATRTLPRGAVLGEGDFELRDTTLKYAGSQPDTTPVAAGWVTRRTINAGEILREPAVEAPAIVDANSPVLIEWRDGSVRITVAGIAARDGAMGDRIPVRTESGKRFEATVVAPGRVRIY
jgi:flagella basal body P-ring formation protein FlgA